MTKLRITTTTQASITNFSARASTMTIYYYYYDYNYDDDYFFYFFYLSTTTTITTAYHGSNCPTFCSAMIVNVDDGDGIRFLACNPKRQKTAAWQQYEHIKLRLQCPMP